MKELYLFLDFDGVLNGAINNFGRDQNTRFDKNNLSVFDKLINELQKEYDVKIVINSSWKMISSDTKKWVNNFLSKEHNPLIKYKDIIINATPTYHFYDKEYCCKKFEVESYVVHNFENTSNKEFLILDDEIVKNGYMSFIKIYRTNGEYGLISNDIKNILNLLKENI